MKSLKTAAILASAAFIPLQAHAQVTLTNPLGETDPRLIIARVIQGALSITGTLALIMIIYAGLMWMTARGKPELVKKGQHIIIWSVLGIIVIAAAYVLTNAVFNAVLTGDVAG